MLLCIDETNVVELEASFKLVQDTKRRLGCLTPKKDFLSHRPAPVTQLVTSARPRKAEGSNADILQDPTFYPFEIGIDILRVSVTPNSLTALHIHGELIKEAGTVLPAIMLVLHCRDPVTWYHIIPSMLEDENGKLYHRFYVPEEVTTLTLSFRFRDLEPFEAEKVHMLLDLNQTRIETLFCNVAYTVASQIQGRSLQLKLPHQSILHQFIDRVYLINESGSYSNWCCRAREYRHIGIHTTRFPVELDTKAHQRTCKRCFARSVGYRMHLQSYGQQAVVNQIQTSAYDKYKLEQTILEQKEDAFLQHSRRVTQDIISALKDAQQCGSQSVLILSDKCQPHTQLEIHLKSLLASMPSGAQAMHLSSLVLRQSIAAGDTDGQQVGWTPSLPNHVGLHAMWFKQKAIETAVAAADGSKSERNMFDVMNSISALDQYTCVPHLFSLPRVWVESHYTSNLNTCDQQYMNFDDSKPYSWAKPHYTQDQVQDHVGPVSKQLPLVCIYIPVLNQLKLLVNCIRSLLSQTYVNIQVVVLDGGSSDASEAYIRSVQSRDFRLHWVSVQSQKPFAAVIQSVIVQTHAEYVILQSPSVTSVTQRVEQQVRTVLDSLCLSSCCRVLLSSAKNGENECVDAEVTLDGMIYNKTHLETMTNSILRNPVTSAALFNADPIHIMATKYLEYYRGEEAFSATNAVTYIRDRQRKYLHTLTDEILLVQ